MRRRGRRRGSARPRSEGTMGLQVGIALWLVLTPALGWAATPSRQAATPEGGPRVGLLREVAVLTGQDSINETHTRWGVDGTDLGHTFDHQGLLYMVFGDTFGPAKSDWRSNVAAVITDDDPSDGLTFDRMI